MRRTEFKHYLGPAIRRDLDERIHDAIPARRHRVALGEKRPRWLIDLETKLHGDVRRERLYAPPVAVHRRPGRPVTSQIRVENASTSRRAP